MTIENLSRLVEGELLTSPCVSSIKNIEFSSKRVKPCDAFFYTGIEDLKEAVKNGAYAVIFDKDDIEILDREIAWIKVKSLKRALIRILRFHLREKAIKVFWANEIASSIIKSASLSKDIIFVEDFVYDVFQKIFHAKNGSIIIGSDRDFLKNIYPDYAVIDSKSKDFKILKNSVFETSFLYKEKFFKNIKIPVIFQKDLQKALEFFSKNEIDFDLHSLNFIKGHFEPVFINSFFIQKPFGSTQRVLIFEKDEKFLQKEIEFLRKEARWASSVIFIPKEENIEIKGVRIYKIDDFLDIKKVKNFHFGIIFGKKEDFLPILEYRNDNQISLFKE